VLYIYNVLFIGKQGAKNIVFKHLNIKENEAKKIDISFDYESGLWEYNVEFIYNNLEYDYIIDAKNGDIILHQIDK